MPELTTVCYIEHEGKYLMLHRVKKKKDINKNKWIGIGGHFMNGESPEECMIREVYEETGLTVTEYSYRGIVTFFFDGSQTEYMHLFTATGFSGELTANCDEGELAWIPKNQLSLIPMWEGDKIFLDLISRPEEPFFSLKLVYSSDRLERAVLNGKQTV